MFTQKNRYLDKNEHPVKPDGQYQKLKIKSLNENKFIGQPVSTGTATQPVHIQKENNPSDHHHYLQDPLCHDDEDLCEKGSGSVQYKNSE